MSVASLLAIADRHLKTASEECDAGRGEQVLEDFMSNVGADFAASVYLDMETVCEGATEETAPDLLDWATGYPESVAVSLADAIRRGASELYGAEDVEYLAAVAVQAYADRMNALFAAPEGGAA